MNLAADTPADSLGVLVVVTSAVLVFSYRSADHRPNATGVRVWPCNARRIAGGFVSSCPLTPERRCPMKRAILVATVIAALAAPVAAWAGPDAAQQALVQKMQEAQRKLRAAEQAREAERQKLLGEHMKMVDRIMDEMRAMSPRPGMTVKEQEEWIAEHRKLIDTAMDQMMQDHRLLMGMSCK